MLAIRLQRTGRKGHAHFRIVVQDSRRTPKSGRIVMRLGHYDPHTKETVIDKEKAAFYLEHGAQPSERVVSLLKAEKITLPSWVKEASTTAPEKRATKNPDKLRKNRPAEETVPEEAPAAATEEEAQPAADETDQNPAE